MVEDPPYHCSQQGRSAGVRVDYIGIALLALGVGALQILLDKGQEDDWFGSHFIVTLAAISASCLVSLVFWELHTKAPVIDMRMFKSFNFAVANLMMFVLGMLLFSSLVMMPQFLQTLMGYTAESAGLVLSGAGVIMLIEMPIVGQLTTKIPAKYIMAFGWLCLAFGMYYSTKGVGSADQLPGGERAAHGAGVRPGLPVRAHHAERLHRDSAGEGQQRFGPGEFHAQHRKQRGNLHGHDDSGAAGAISPIVLSYHATNYDPAFRNQVNGLSRQLVHAGASAPDAQVQAYGRIYQSLQVQSQTLAYIDTFMVLAVAAGIMFLLAFIVRKNDPVAAGGQCSGESKEGMNDSMIKVLTIEREYGSGAAEIAEKLADRLGWKLWDQLLTDEIARRLECDSRHVEQHEERRDPLHYRLFKAFLRGSFEGSLNAPRMKMADAEGIRQVTEQLVRAAADEGNCVIVGRGSAYYLQRSPRRLPHLHLRAVRREGAPVATGRKKRGGSRFSSPRPWTRTARPSSSNTSESSGRRGSFST